MISAVVRSSDLLKSGRWDAKYHVARVNNKATVEKLMAMPDGQFDRLYELLPRYKSALTAVTRGHSPHHMNASLDSYSREEKAVYVALCLQEVGEMEARAGALEQQAADVKRVRTEIAEITSLQLQLPFP